MWIEEEILTIFGTIPYNSILRCKENIDDYSWACVVEYWWGHSLAMIKCVQTAPTLAEARLVKQYLKDKGIKIGRWERKIGIPRITEIKAKETP